MNINGAVHVAGDTFHFPPRNPLEPGAARGTGKVVPL